MSKKIEIGREDDIYYLEITGKDKTGITYHKRTNYEKRITSYLEREGLHFIDVKKKGADLFLYTASGTIFFIKDFQSLMNVALLKPFFDRFFKSPIAGNLESGKRSTGLQMLGLRILYSNKTKIAALALTGTLLVTNLPFVSPVIIHHQEEAIVTEEAGEVRDTAVQIPEVDISSLRQDLFQAEMTFDYRLEQTTNLQLQYHGYDNSKIMLGARVNADKIAKIINSSRGNIIIETAQRYGIDPYLLLAKGMTESSLEHEACSPGGSRYNGYGVGAFQLETPDGRNVSAWNFETECEESLSVTMENAIDFNKNVQAAAMYLQNRIHLYNGNIYLALQSYNYGPAMMSVIIHDYAKQKGITEEEVKNNLDDLGWLEIVKDVHENPNNYYYRVTIDLDETNPEIIAQAKNKYVWKHGKYGNSHYIADVLSYYVGLKCQNKNMDGSSIVIDLMSNEIFALEIPNHTEHMKI